MAINAIPPLDITIHPAQTGSGSAASGQFWSSDAPNFKDILDIINPLQHIPIISTIYQSLTGDKPSSGANLAGGALMGGPIGFGVALFNEIVKTQTGADVGGNVMAALQGKAIPALQQGNAQTVMVASNTPLEPYMSANQRAAYNAYTHIQNTVAQNMFA